MARSTFPSQNVQNITKHFSLGAPLEVEMFKKCSCGAKNISKSKCTKHFSLGAPLEVEMSKNCTPLWREAHFQIKIYKTPFSDHFWKLRCQKSGRRCGAKHISKSKCAKHIMFRALLEADMLKKCTLLWREAHFQVKTYKTPQPRSTFGI